MVRRAVLDDEAFRPFDIVDSERLFDSAVDGAGRLEPVAGSLVHVAVGIAVAASEGLVERVPDDLVDTEEVPSPIERCHQQAVRVEAFQPHPGIGGTEDVVTQRARHPSEAAHASEQVGVSRFETPQPLVLDVVMCQCDRIGLGSARAGRWVVGLGKRSADEVDAERPSVGVPNQIIEDRVVELRPHRLGHCTGL